MLGGVVRSAVVIQRPEHSAVFLIDAFIREEAECMHGFFSDIEICVSVFFKIVILDQTGLIEKEDIAEKPGDTAV